MVYVFHDTKLWSKHRPNRGRTNEVLRHSTAAAVAIAAAVKDRSSWAVTAVVAVANVSRGLHAIARAHTYIRIRCWRFFKRERTRKNRSPCDRRFGQMWNHRTRGKHMYTREIVISVSFQCLVSESKFRGCRFRARDD